MNEKLILIFVTIFLVATLIYAIAEHQYVENESSNKFIGMKSNELGEMLLDANIDNIISSKWLVSGNSTLENATIYILNFGTFGKKLNYRMLQKCVSEGQTIRINSGGTAWQCAAFSFTEKYSTSMEGYWDSTLYNDSYMKDEGGTQSATLGYKIYPTNGNYEDFSCRLNVVSAGTFGCSFKVDGVTKCSCVILAISTGMQSCTQDCSASVLPSHSIGSFYLTFVTEGSAANIRMKVNHVHGELVIPTPTPPP